MSDQPGTSEDRSIQRTTIPANSLGAARMRAHRQRRREGLRCITLEIRNTEVDALIRKNLLKPENRSDSNAIVDALYLFLDRALDG